MNYLIDLMPQGSKATVLFHTTTWFKKGGGNSHRDVGYSSDDQASVDLMLDLLLKYGKGLPPAQLGVIVDLYNPNDKGALMLLAGSEKRGMKFSLCFDKGISKAGDPKVMLAAVDLAKKNFFGSPAFTKDENGKLFCIDFNAGYADWPAISKQYGLHVCHWKNDKVNGFSWLFGTKDKTRLIADNQLVYMPSVSPQFDDHKFNDPAHSVWGTTDPARKVDGENGALWLAAWKSIPATARFIQVVTLTDFEERTAILGNLGFPGLPADVIVPGTEIPNVSADPLPHPVVPPPPVVPPAPPVKPPDPVPVQDAFVSRAEFNVVLDRLKAAGIP